jgi:threonyl-tRNA synthetase
MHVILPDGSQKELPDGASGADLAAAIGPGLARAALAVKVGGELRDLARPLSDADFEALEARMREHIKAAEPFEREDVSTGAALDRFTREGQDYKVELIEDLIRDTGVETVSLYTNGPFTDLCRGPHAPATDRIKAFKLLSVAGAYWRGDASRQMLTRIYGTAFHSKQDLADHLERLEQARARDHRKLGRELGLFGFSELSPGSTFWTPAGTAVYNALVARSRAMSVERGYTEIKTPLL